MKISLFANHFEVQSNFVLTKKFGLSAGINGAFRGQLGGELGGIYYKKFNERNYFEVQGGYGYFNNKTKAHMSWSALAGERGTWYYVTSDIRYHKIFVQPTYFITTKKANIGFALKVSANYYDNFHYYSCKTVQDYVYNDYYHTTNFRYKWNFVIEPVLKIHFNKKIFLQFAGIFSNNICTSPSYFEVWGHEGGLISFKETGTVKGPEHISFIFTIGYEIKFGKKRGENIE